MQLTCASGGKFAWAVGGRLISMSAGYTVIKNANAAGNRVHELGRRSSRVSRVVKRAVLAPERFLRLMDYTCSR